MISLCTVTLGNVGHYEDILIKSILKHTKLVKEVILAHNDKFPEDYEEREYEERGIKFHRFGSYPGGGWSPGDLHAIGLHACLQRATQPYVYWCDPDICLLSNVDEFYMELLQKHNLNVIGGSHHAAATLPMTFFPWHGNILMKKTDLPDSTFLAEEVRGEPWISGYWLMCGLGKMYQEEYPNPSGTWDTGSSLYLWAKRNNWQWLAFQTTDTHLYTTNYHRGSFRLKDKLPKQHLFYHAVSGTIVEQLGGEQARSVWEPFQKISV